jgi:Tripartite tricarboxylate transporter family receptor
MSPIGTSRPMNRAPKLSGFWERRTCCRCQSDGNDPNRSSSPQRNWQLLLNVAWPSDNVVASSTAYEWISRLGMKKLLAIAFAFVTASTASAAGPDYPSKPVTIVVPFAAGGPVDTRARLLAEHMRSSLGQPVIIENVSGAAGSLGTGRVARSAPDGYTLSIGVWSTHVVNAVIYALRYDVLNDFEPVALLTNNPVDRRKEDVAGERSKRTCFLVKGQAGSGDSGHGARRTGSSASSTRRSWRLWPILRPASDF